MYKVRELFNLRPKKLVDENPDLLFGVECEIESIQDCEKDFLNFTNTEDHSLRNIGREYVSHPLPIDKLITSFKRLHSTLVINNPAEKFSDRTSTHIHMNCRDLYENEVSHLVRWYALYEPFFFALVDLDRKNNIYCVPLNYTHLPSKYGLSLSSLVGNWHKYTAFNILPLKDKGTVEFRHLEGMDDHVRLEKWLVMLTRLRNWAKEHPINKDTLSSTELLEQGRSYIFEAFPIVQGMDMQSLEDTLIDVKLSVYLYK